MVFSLVGARFCLHVLELDLAWWKHLWIAGVEELVSQRSWSSWIKDQDGHENECGVDTTFPGIAVGYIAQSGQVHPGWKLGHMPVTSAQIVNCSRPSWITLYSRPALLHRSLPGFNAWVIFVWPHSSTVFLLQVINLYRHHVIVS